MHDTPSDIVVMLYRAAAGSVPWAEALKRLGDSVGGAFTLIGIVDKVGQRTNSITSEPFDPERRERYRGRYFALNPRVAHSARQPVGKIFYEAAIAPDRVLARHPYYAEYLAQRDFTHFISANLENGAARRVNLSVQRSRRAGHVDKSDVRVMKAIVPHAVAAFELWETLQGVSMQTLLIMEAFEALAAGVFVIDEGGALMFANRASAEMLAPAGPFVTAGNALTVAGEGQRDAFANLLSAARLTSGGAEQSEPACITLSAEGGERFRATMRPMPEMITLEGAHRSCIIVTAERIQPLSTTDELQRLLGLTAGEASLALALADGARPSDYARERGIGGETVKAQLAALRAKLVATERGRAVATVLHRTNALQRGPSGPALAFRTGAQADRPWAEQYGLTRAEARLAAFLLDGGTTAGYAAAHRLSPHTVRNQLRSIYAKTNTNRQVSLLQLLLRDPGKKH